MITLLAATGLLKWAAGGLAAFLAVIAYGWRKQRAGAQQARREAALEAAERYAATRKAMDHEESVFTGDVGVLREWLRDRDPATK